MDNPLQEYNIRTNAACPLTNVGQTFNTGDNGATGLSGMSDERLNIAATSATTNMFKLVRSANIPGQNDLTVGGADVVVMITPLSALYN
jgi:hypothetical protein